MDSHNIYLSVEKKNWKWKAYFARQLWPKKDDFFDWKKKNTKIQFNGYCV